MAWHVAVAGASQTKTPKAMPPINPSGGAGRDSAPGLALSQRVLVEAAPVQWLSKL